MSYQSEHPNEVERGKMVELWEKYHKRDWWPGVFIEGTSWSNSHAWGIGSFVAMSTIAWAIQQHLMSFPKAYLFFTEINLEYKFCIAGHEECVGPGKGSTQFLALADLLDKVEEKVNSLCLST